MLNRVIGWFQNRKGQGLVEYILLVCLIAMVVGAAILLFGSSLSDAFHGFVAVLSGWCGICHP